ncbi:EamA family transporter [Stappia sp. GBMRC 2046]|uniref:EamA family transporter n=2 Tax=Stappia sediminis TaxID=2692190 RepID=A0A7X3LYC9_9HYPH|nr:EamA family transporter [Stappia sediminis]
MDFRENSKAIVAMMLAMLGFIVNDTLVKVVSERLPLGEIMFVRGIIAIVFILGLSAVTGMLSQYRHLNHKTVPIRALAEVCATILYLTALFQMPIANATAILQALPLVVTAAAAIFFAAPVGWRRWSAIGVGFAGVLLIVRPGLEGFDSWALVALAGVFCMAVRDLATQRMPKNVPTLGAAAATLVGVSVVGLALSVRETWVVPTGNEFALLVGAALFINIGFSFIIIAMRTGDISVVAPFRYSIILWAIALGYLVWGDVPDVMTLAGTAIIVTTGIYSFFRERKLASQAAKPLHAKSEAPALD